MLTRLFLPAFVLSCAAFGVHAAAADIDHLQGEMVGEVTTTTAILQTRLTASRLDEHGDVPGAVGMVRFEYATDENFTDSTMTPWQKTKPDNDYIARAYPSNLESDTRYYYRIHFGETEEDARVGLTRTFKTHIDPLTSIPKSFVVITGMNYHKFHRATKQRERALATGDIPAGYPALDAIRALKPDFFISTGDSVYYDHPPKAAATDKPSMRKKWHEQFVQRRFVDLFAEVPTYWLKDDHDHRYNDNDNTGDRPPSSELGIEVYHEQLPILYEGDVVGEQNPYRAHRISNDLQIWLLEGRDFRDPNNKKPGPNKTLWGRQQRKWLEHTILQSRATFKIIISPTPMVGPDDAYKKDNHTNPGGFTHEADDFFNWAKTALEGPRNLLFICGDRHWQYHSIHPTGYHEFSTGALVDANSRLGRKPGEKGSTDPEGKIRQPYTSAEPSGGFLHVTVEYPNDGPTPELVFQFRDEHGELLYEHRVSGEPPD